MSFLLKKNIFENNIVFLYQVLAGVQIWLEVSGHGPFHVSNEPWTLHSGWFETISSHPAAVWCDDPKAEYHNYFYSFIGPIGPWKSRWNGLFGSKNGQNLQL